MIHQKKEWEELPIMQRIDNWLKTHTYFTLRTSDYLRIKEEIERLNVIELKYNVLQKEIEIRFSLPSLEDIDSLEDGKP